MRLLAYFAIATVILATPGMAVGEESGKVRTCRIIYLRAPTGAPHKMHLFDGKTSQEVDLPRMNLSRPYTLPSGRVKIRMLPDPVVDPKKLPKEAPGAVIPPEMLDCYLLVTTDTNNAIAPVRLQLINANEDRFGNGQILWLNPSPHMVKGTVGNQKLKLPPQSRRLMKPPVNKRGRYPVDLSFVISGDERTHPLCETSWLHDPRSRMIAFVFMEEGRRTPRVLAFSDFRGQQEKPKP